MELRPLSPLPVRARGGQGRAAPGPARSRRKGATHAPWLQSSCFRSRDAGSAPSRDRPPASPPTGQGRSQGAGKGRRPKGAGWGAGVGAAAAAELLLGAFCMKMAAPTASKAASLGCNNKPTFPELDFRSGARVEELNKLIQEFTKHDQREYDDQRALEIHTAKDFIFSMLGKEEKKGEVCGCDENRGGKPIPLLALSFLLGFLPGAGCLGYNPSLVPSLLSPPQAELPYLPSLLYFARGPFSSVRWLFC